MTPPEITVMLAVPAVLIRFAGTEAVNWVALPNVVIRDEPFHCTAAPRPNPLPFTVKVKAGWPAITAVGLSELIVGNGADNWIVAA